MKRILIGLLCLMLALPLWGCKKEASEPTTVETTLETTVPQETEEPARERMLLGISLPDESERWTAEGQALSAGLEDLGYQVMLNYAGGLARNQVEQLQTMIDSGAKCLVIAAVDSAELLAVEQAAKEKGITVIAYDRLLMDTDAVDAYIGFDYYAVGEYMGTRIVEDMALEEASEPYTIEFFMGSPEDNNALLQYEGVMSVLQPYLDSGVLVCLSGRTAFEDCCFVDSSQADAYSYCESYLTDYYIDETLDICCAATDPLAAGCVEALENGGYTEENWPYITGSGGEKSAKQRIVAGKQAMTVGMDTVLLAQRCVKLVDGVLFTGYVELAEPQSRHNNVQDVPTYLIEFETVGIEDLESFSADNEPTDAEEVTEPEE